MITTLVTLAVLAQAPPAPTPRAPRPTAPAAPAAAADRELRQLSDQFQAAWNGHDARALSALFAEAADMIVDDERAVVSREEVQKEFLARNAKDATKESTAQVRVISTRFVRPDVAVADWGVLVRGTRSPDGTASPPQLHRVTAVLTREGGAWTIASLRMGRPRIASPDELGVFSGPGGVR